MKNIKNNKIQPHYSIFFCLSGLSIALFNMYMFYFVSLFYMSYYWLIQATQLQYWDLIAISIIVGLFGWLFAYFIYILNIE